MNKRLLLVLLVLAGCSHSNSSKNTNVSEPPKNAVRNEQCKNIRSLKIFQTLDDGALAHECEYDWLLGETRCGIGTQIFFVQNQDSVDYYDGKNVVAPKGKCFAMDGVYKYISMDKRARTVPKVKIADSTIPSPSAKPEEQRGK